MKEREFTGHVTMMRADAEFYGAEDFIGRGDVPMQIEKVLEWENRKACGKTQELMHTLKFVGGTKELWIKATNRKMLTHLYGPNASAWKGKWVWICVEQCKSPNGGQTLGIRFRDRKDAPKQEQPAAAQSAPSSGVTDQQVSELRARLAVHIPNDAERKEYVVTTLGVKGNPTHGENWTRDQYAKATIFCDEMEGPV